MNWHEGKVIDMAERQRRFTIGELSKLTGISITALRYYDRERILVPEIRNEENGYRYYSVKQLEKAQMIRDLKALDLSLEEIKDIIERKSQKHLEERLYAKIQGLGQEIDVLERKLLSAQNAYRKMIRGKTYMDADSTPPVEQYYPVDVAPIKEMWVLYTRYPSNVNAKSLFSDRCLELQKIRSSYNLYPVGSYIGIFHDGYKSQFHSERGDLELCLPVIKPDGFWCKEMRRFGGMLAASTVSIGSYQNMEKVYRYLEEWIEANGYTIIGPPHEYYLMDISNTFSEEQYMTKIHFPVEKRTK